MRIRGAKTELEEAGLETDGMVESTAKLREEIMALSGVDIMEANGQTFKSTYQIMEELADKWQDLSDIQQATVTELIAGKRQGNIVSSLMNNFDIAEKALETSLNSSGSAMAEHAKWQQSLEAQILKLKAAWQSLSQSFMSSDFLKGAMDAIIGLVDGITTLIDTFGTLPTLIGAFAAFESFQGVGFFKTIEDEATLSGKRITSAFSDAARQTNEAFSTIGLSKDSSFKSSIEADIEAFNNWTRELNKGVPEADAFNKIFANASASAKKFAQDGKLVTEGMDAFVQKQKEAQVATLAQNKSLGNARAIIKEYFSGCKNVEMSQKSFADAVSKTNPQLGKQLSATKNANSAFIGYTTSLVGAKIATFALEAATMALNAAVTMGISALVSFAIKAFDEMYESADELSERIDEVVTKFNDQQKELVKNKASFKSDAERYAELSKGVDNLGRNVSLTAEEYSEYQSVVNKVAEQIPSLISGYDSQGNAILNVKGNVEELVAAYEKLIEAQNREVLTSAGDIAKDFRNSTKKANENTEGWFGWGWTQGLNLGSTKLSTESAKVFKNILNSKDSIAEINRLLSDEPSSPRDPLNQDIYDEVLRDFEALSKLLEDAGFEKENGFLNFESDEEHVKRAFKENKNIVNRVLDDFYADLEAETDGMKSIAEAALSNAFDISSSDYYGMNDTLKNVARQMVNSFDYEFFAGLEADGISVEDYVNNMLKQLDSISDRSNEKIEAAFDLQTQFNGGEIPYGEYVKGLEDTGKLIDSLSIDKELKTQLKLSIGLNEAGIVDEYQKLVNKLSDHTNYDFDARITSNVAKEFLNSLSAEELSVAVGIIAEMSDNDIEESIQDIRDAINREMAVQGLTFDLNLEIEATSVDAFNTALAETVTASGLSSDSISALKGRYAELESQGYDLSAMFEETSNGIHLNRKAVGELERAYATRKQADIKEDLQSLQKEYDLLTNDINNCNDASERASLYVQRDAIAQQINDAATLAAQYRGLTSAYNDWLAAEEAGQERDMYENIIEGLENIDDEISRGWFDDGTIEFLELLTGKDLSTSSIDDLTAAYKGLKKEIGDSGYSIRDFFTVNEDGDSTNAGVYNFLETIESFDKLKGAIQRDKETGEIEAFNFSVVGGDQAIAEALGISEELVQIMVRAADDAGFVVTLDGAYTQLADLKASAEEANDTLKKLGKTDVDFNFGAKSLEDLNGELEKATVVLEQFRNKDGTINMEMEGAEEALEIASYFTATIDKLTEPVYMQLETNQVEKDLQEPLTKMQEFERLTKQKHQFELTGDTKDLEKVEAEMTEIATYLDGLDEETQIKLGIDGLSMEEIKSKLEQGEIEIPATVDIQLEMSEDIRDMRLMMMNQLGLISDEQLKLEIEYGVDSSAVEDYTPEQQKAIVEYFAEHDEVDSYTPEQKEALVKFIAETEDLDSYTPEEKQAIVEYLTDSGDPDSWTPEQKEAVAKFKKDSAEVDNYTPEQKEAIAKYIKNSIEPDNYQPDDKDATVTYGKDSTAVDSYDPPNFFRKVFYDLIENGSVAGESAADKRTGSNLKVSDVNGTAHADGTAFKQGDWRTKKTETALTGELGREIVVTPNNHWYTVGDSGAEFVNIPRGSIVFNHRQTEELLANGKVTSDGGRGKALAGGTAYSLGVGGALGRVTTVYIEDGAKKKKETIVSGSKGEDGGIGKNGDSNSNSSGSGKGGKGSSSKEKEKKEFEELIDWIETKIDRIERAIDRLDLKANSIYKSWSVRNSALIEQIDKVREEIDLQQRAYDRYIQQADSVGLDSAYAEKVRNGEIDIETITDEALKEKIDNYQQWYDKALECQGAIDELKETESELYAQRFQHVQSQYDGILQGYEHTEAMLNEYISQAEEKGYIVSKKYYQALIDNEKSNIAELKREQADLIAERDNAVAEGKITKGSEAWLEQCAAIDEVTQAIEEGSTALLEYARAMEEIDWSIFDLIQERISGVTEEADFLIELMSNKKLFDDDGKLTSQGLATMGLHAQNYNTHMYAADEYGAEVAKLNKQIENDPYDQELINRRNELLELQRESILAAEDEKNAIRDMVEEGISLELNALQELIDKKNEALESERDLYEYQKKVKEQTKEIASLEKQMAAYQNDDSEEAKQKIQQIKVDLETARQDLQETEYDKFVDDTSSMLDTLYNEYELILNARLDNIDYLLESVIESINAAASADGDIASALGSEGAIAIAVSNNAASIKDTLTSETNKVGITLSNAVKDIWSTGDGNAKSVLTMYGEDFRTKSTTIITTLNGIKSSVNSMVASINKEAEKKTTANKTTTSAKKNPTTTSTTNKTTTTKKVTTKKSGDGTPKIGDRVKYVNGQYYYDSQGKKPLGSHKKGEYVYITNINKKNWATHGYHISTGNKLGKGDLGWLKLNQLSGYATGKKNFLDDEIAWTQENGLEEYIVRPSDGAILTPIARKGSVLNAQASDNLWNMTNSPAEFIKDNLGLGSASVPNNSTVSNAITQNFENIVFSMPNVKNYGELLLELQKDPKFDKLIKAITIDQIAGKSSLGKGKSIR